MGLMNTQIPTEYPITKNSSDPESEVKNIFYEEDKQLTTKNNKEYEALVTDSP